MCVCENKAISLSRNLLIASKVKWKKFTEIEFTEISKSANKIRIDYILILFLSKWKSNTNRREYMNFSFDLSTICYCSLCKIEITSQKSLALIKMVRIWNTMLPYGTAAIVSAPPNDNKNAMALWILIKSKGIIMILMLCLA